MILATHFFSNRLNHYTLKILEEENWEGGFSLKDKIRSLFREKWKTGVMLLIMIFLFISCFNQINFKDKQVLLEEELVKQKAITISMAIYSGCEDYLLNESSEKIHEYLLEVVEYNKGNRIEKIKINGFKRNEDGSMDVFVQIYDERDLGVEFHDMKFRKSGERWILEEFGVDA